MHGLGHGHGKQRDDKNNDDATSRGSAKTKKTEKKTV